MMDSESIGLLLIRLVVGGVIIANGLEKLVPVASGGGLNRAAAQFRTLGLRPPRAMALLAGVLQSVGGLLLAVGLFTAVAAAAVAATMVIAIAYFSWRRGFWSRGGGLEYPLVLLVASLALAFTGPGRVAVDTILGSQMSGTAVGVATTLAALCALPITGLVNFLAPKNPI
jgi:putative oxidoreductase